MKNNKVKIVQEMTFYSLMAASLKGISQVIFIESVISGFIILVAITIANYTVGLIAIISSIIGTLMGRIGGGDKTALNQGLFGYNSVLIGIALTIYMTGGISWEVAFIGAALAAVITGAMMHFFKDMELPVLTFPFVAMTWIFLLASYHFNVLTISPQLTPQNLSGWELITEGSTDITSGLVEGIGQVYFQDKLLSGILILIAVFWANWKWGIYTLAGTAIGWLTAYILGPEVTLLNLGLYGYNAVLTMLAVGVVFDADRPFAPITSVVAAMVSVLLAAGLHSVLLPYGLPVLTMPFVIVTWVFLGARKQLPKI